MLLVNVGIHTYQEIYSSELTNPSLLGVKEVSSTLSKVSQSLFLI